MSSPLWRALGLGGVAAVALYFGASCFSARVDAAREAGYRDGVQAETERLTETAIALADSLRLARDSVMQARAVADAERERARLEAARVARAGIEASRAVRAVLDSLGASTRDLDAYDAAVEDRVAALETEIRVERDLAGLERLRADRAEAALLAEQRVTSSLRVEIESYEREVAILRGAPPTGLFGRLFGEAQRAIIWIGVGVVGTVAVVAAR